jgi:hypothetical protein
MSNAPYTPREGDRVLFEPNAKVAKFQGGITGIVNRSNTGWIVRTDFSGHPYYLGEVAIKSLLWRNPNPRPKVEEWTRSDGHSVQWNDEGFDCRNKSRYYRPSKTFLYTADDMHNMIVMLEQGIEQAQWDEENGDQS